MIDLYIKAAISLSRELRRGLLSLDSLRRGDWFSFWDDARPLFNRADEMTAAILRDAQLAGWVDVAENLFRKAEVEPLPIANPLVSLFDHPGLPKVAVPLRNVEAGARNLINLRAMTKDKFDALEGEARSTAFTVARLKTDETVEKVQTALAEAVRDGQTYREFRRTFIDTVDGSPLGEHQIEAVYRTVVGRAQTAGMVDTLTNPMVRDEFPYLLWSATHDGRTEETHLEMERSGLDGTAVYRADDPIWYTFLPPCRWNCRCTVVPLSIEDAAAYGVKEAREWEKTGRPPTFPELVKWIPLTPVKGWVPTGGKLLAV